MDRSSSTKESALKSARRVADFIMLTQRSFLLDLSSELSRGSVSFPQFFLLGCLAKEDYLTMKDIATKMGHSTAAATGLVDRLERFGYVQRLHAEDDRRKVLVQITRKGIDLVERMRQDIVHTLAETMASMEEREQVALGRDFERLAASFEKHQSSSS